MNKLYPFQEETVERSLNFLKQNISHSVYVANEPGLGKSATSVITANRLKAKRILVVCPAIMRSVWQDQIRLWTDIPDHTTHVVYSGKDLSLKTPKVNYLITSYSLASSSAHADLLAADTFDLIILDEAHYLCNYKAKRTKVILARIAPKATYKILLSGTPMSSGASQLYTTFSFILPDLFPSWFYFVSRYCHKKVTPFATMYTGVKNADELSSIIRSKFYIRYKKEEVLKDLPAKQHLTIPLESKYSVKLHGTDALTIEQDLKAVEAAVLDGRPIVLPASVAGLRRLQGEAKAGPVAEYAHELLEQQIPLVIFAHHKAVITKLACLLADYSPRVISGETSMTDRQTAVSEFQSGKCNLVIANFQAGGIGITLTRSSNVLLAELDYSPAIIDQAINRCHRIGTLNSVQIHWFSVTESMDARIEKILRDKTESFNSLLDKS